jgi:hypothetical protein
MLWELTVSEFCMYTAFCRGVLPFSVSANGSAPMLPQVWWSIHAGFGACAAPCIWGLLAVFARRIWGGCVPQEHLKSASAASVRPLSAAWCSGVHCARSRASTVAPASARRSTTCVRAGSSVANRKLQKQKGTGGLDECKNLVKLPRVSFADSGGIEPPRVRKMPRGASRSSSCASGPARQAARRPQVPSRPPTSLRIAQPSRA